MSTAESLATVQPACSVPHLLSTLFGLLEQNGIRYCVLHSWQRLPHDLPSDLDLAVHPADAKKIPQLIRALAGQGYAPVQMLHYAVTSFRYDFAWATDAGIAYAGIDITYQYREGGLIFMSAASLVAGRQRQSGFWVADSATEFAYLFAKKTCKGTVSARQQQRLKKLAEDLGTTKAESALRSLFGRKQARTAVRACLDEQLAGMLPLLKRQLWLNVLIHQPLNPVRDLLGNYWRFLQRWRRPTGLLVVFLGPDGAGKSSIISELHGALEPTFRGHRIFHWRPMLLHRGDGNRQAITNPHSQPARGQLASVIVCCGLLLDYWLGYLLVVKPLLSRTRLVVFDRYFHDALADPLRYRNGAPASFVRFLSRLVPPANALYIFLDADEDLILSRKHEVTTAELKRQREAYARLVPSLHAVSVRSDQDLQVTLRRVSLRIVQCLAERFERRYET